MSARVLIIDDEEALRVSVGKIVSRLGHEVQLAAAGAEGLDRVAREAFELVLTDFRLPDMDGLDVLERVRRIRPEAEVILFTGFGSIPLAAQAIKQGAYDFVTKPVKRADLERVVNRAIEKQALAAAPADESASIQIPVGTSLEDAERLLISEALRRAGGNKVRAASLLGISPRTVHRKHLPGNAEEA